MPTNNQSNNLSKREEEVKEERCVHKVYYCLATGGNRCRKCKKLLNDFGKEYQEITKTIKIIA